MIDKLNLAIDLVANGIALAVRLLDDAPNKDEARAQLVARVRRLLEKSDLLKDLHDEDQRILDSRIAKP